MHRKAYSASSKGVKDGSRGSNGPILSRKKKFLYSLIITFVAFGFLEGALRIVGFSFNPLTHADLFVQTPEADNRREYVRDQERFWLPRPGDYPAPSFGADVPARISSLGTRGPKPTSPKSDDMLRILCLGDSGTFGMGVGDSDTWPAHLQKILAGWGRGQHLSTTFEVINAGVCAYSTYQAIQHYRKLAPVLEPDIVIIATGVNDKRLLPIADVERERQSWLQIALLESLQHLRLGQLIMWWSQKDLVRQIQAVSQKKLVQRFHNQPPRALKGWKPRVDRQTYQRLLHELRQDLQRKKIPLIGLCRDCYQVEFREVASQDNFYAVDLEPIRRFAKVELFITGLHPGSESYRLIAGVVAEVATEVIKNDSFFTKYTK